VCTFVILNKSVFGFICQLTTWHYLYSPAAIIRYLLPAGLKASDHQQQDAQQLHRHCSAYSVGSANNQLEITSVGKLHSPVDVLAMVHCWTAGLSYVAFSYSAMIEVLFGIWTRVGPSKHVLSGAGSPQGKSQFSMASPSPSWSIGKTVVSQSYWIGGSIDAAFCCQYCIILFSVFLSYSPASWWCRAKSSTCGQPAFLYVSVLCSWSRWRCRYSLQQCLYHHVLLNSTLQPGMCSGHKQSRIIHTALLLVTVMLLSRDTGLFFSVLGWCESAWSSFWFADSTESSFISFSWFISHVVLYCLPSVLWRCWLGGRKGIRPVKTEWWGVGMVVCLEQGGDLHMAQLMPLPLTISGFSKIQIVFFIFLVPAFPGSPRKGR